MEIGALVLEYSSGGADGRYGREEGKDEGREEEKGLKADERNCDLPGLLPDVTGLKTCGGVEGDGLKMVDVRFDREEDEGYREEVESERESDEGKDWEENLFGFSEDFD